MLATIQDAFKRLIEYFKNMEKGRRNRFLILLSIGIALIIGVSVFLSRTTYAVLYSGMQPEQAGEVMAWLKENDVKSKTQGADTILVDSAVVDTVRMQLAAEDLPSGTGFNFDIYGENATGLSSTDREKDVFYQLQIQEYIRLSINALEKVDDSYVIINFAEDSPFVLATEKKAAMASINLRLKEEEALADWEVRSIYSIVSKAVPKLELENISVVDTKMRTYVLKDENDPVTNVTDQMSLQLQVQKQLQEQVINLLTPVFGSGKVLCEVNVKLNFDKKDSQEQLFEPPVAGSDDGIAVSLKELAEVVRNDTEEGVAGFDPNGAASQYQELANTADALYSQVSREVNYEINETRTQIEHQQGTVEDLSVAIILDSSDEEAEDYSEQVRNLVVGAIGVTAEHVSVERLPLAPAAEDNSVTALLEMRTAMQEAARRAELIRIGIIAGSAIIVLVLLFFIIRTLRKPKEVPMEEEEHEGIDLMADEDLLASPEEALAFMEREDAGLQALEEYIEKSPESGAQLLRNWLSE